MTVPAEKIKITPGQIYGRLTVLRVAESTNRKPHWHCKCVCNSLVVIGASNLKRGSTQSCGCLQRDRARESEVTHGCAMKGKITPEYRSWSRMKCRCLNPNFTTFKYYGGQGIKVCKRWLHSFENFLQDMGKRPLGMSLDRWPDKSGNYEKSNCRWATCQQQANNKSNNKFVTHNGETKTVAQWARALRLDPKLLYRRLSKGWNSTRVLTSKRYERANLAA